MALRTLPVAAVGFAVVALAASTASAQARPVVRTTCGAYEAVPSGVSSSGQPTRLSIQRGGRLLHTISDWRISQVECADLESDGQPELIVATNSGGAHCCTTVRAWTLGTAPAQVLEFDAGNGGGFELRDLDGDGKPELLLGDDSFAYFDDLPYAMSPNGLPLVACGGPAGLVDCTTRFPDVLRDRLKRFAAGLRPPKADDVKDVEGAALGVLALSVLLGEEAAGIETIRSAVGSDAVMHWLERARPKVAEWARVRGRKLKTGRR